MNAPKQNRPIVTIGGYALYAVFLVTVTTTVLTAAAVATVKEKLSGFRIKKRPKEAH